MTLFRSVESRLSPFSLHFLRGLYGSADGSLKDRQNIEVSPGIVGSDAVGHIRADKSGPERGLSGDGLSPFTGVKKIGSELRHENRKRRKSKISRSESCSPQ